MKYPFDKQPPEIRHGVVFVQWEWFDENVSPSNEDMVTLSLHNFHVTFFPKGVHMFVDGPEVRRILDIQT